MTLAAHTYLLNTGTGKPVIEIGQTGSPAQRFSLEFTSAEILQFLSRTTATAAAVASAASTTDVWGHSAGVLVNDSERHVYVNGTLAGSDTTARTPNAASINSIYIGAEPDGSPTFDGKMAHPAIWNVALTATEIAMLAAGVSPLAVRPQSLVFYVPHMGRDTSDIDIIGGRVLTNSGTTSDASEPRLLWLPKRRIFIPVSAGGGGAITGTSAASLSVTGALTGTGALASTSTLAFAASSALTGTGALAAAIPLTIAGVKTLTGTGAMATTLPMVFAPAGTLSSASSGSIVGTVPVAFSVAGALTGTGALSSAVPITLSLAGTLGNGGSGSLSSSVGLSLGVAAALTGTGAFTGTAGLTVNLAGAMSGTGAISGSVPVAFTVSGTFGLTGAAPPERTVSMIPYDRLVAVRSADRTIH